MRLILIVIFSFLSGSFYGQKDTLSVVRHTDNDYVVPKDLKVAFIGVHNEIFVDVPSAKSFEVSGDGIEKISKNIYKLFPENTPETIITIDIILKNNKKITERHVFKNRKIEITITCFNYTKGDSVITAQKNQFKNAVIRVIPRDKNLNFSYKVSKFKVFIPGKRIIEVSGEKIDDRTYNQINKYASKGDEISIFEISAEMIPRFNGDCNRIKQMVIKIL